METLTEKWMNSLSPEKVVRKIYCFPMCSYLKLKDEPVFGPDYQSWSNHSSPRNCPTNLLPFPSCPRCFCKETRADLWVNHSLFILRIHYSQCRMGQASPVVLFCSLTRWQNFLNWTTINGAAFTTQWGILLLVCGSLSLPAAAGTGMKNSQSPKYSKMFDYQGVWDMDMIKVSSSLELERTFFLAFDQLYLPLTLRSFRSIYC